MMKAVVLKEKNVIEMQTVSIPAIPMDWALIKVVWVAVCATDLDLIAGNVVPVTKPIIPGHEWSGVVVETKNPLHKKWVGKRVIGSNDLSCGVCHQCMIGNIRYCNDYKEIGFLENGAYAEYMAVPVKNLLELPVEISLKQGALLEPLSVGVGAVTKANVQLGDNITVIGMGSVGLNIILAAKAAGACNIIAAAYTGGRSQLAKHYGAKYTVETKRENLLNKISEYHPEGSNIVFDATGNPECIQTAIDATCFGGTIILAGFGGFKIMPIVMDTIGIKNQKIIGAGKNWGQLPKVLSLVENGVSTECMATNIFSLEEYDRALTLAKERPQGFVKAMMCLDKGYE